MNNNQLIKSGFVCAGLDSFTAIVDRFFRGRTKCGHYDNHFTISQVNDMFKSVCSGFLHSYGISFSGKKNFVKYNRSIAKRYEFFKNTGFYDNCNLYVDSGGFQASIGKIDKHEVEILIKEYHIFLNQYHQFFERAFILDLPPGPDCKIYDNWNDVLSYNRRTYNMAAELPDEVRDKMIYVHHFRTPKSWETFTKIMREDNLFDKFNYHATGGIVANLSGDTIIPTVIYALPLVPLLNEAIKCGRKFLNFHILGGANYRDILFYELFMKHVKKIHDIDLTITYDSSAVFKNMFVGRRLNIFEGERVYKIDFRTDSLDKKFNANMTIVEKLREVLNNFAKQFNFKKLNVTDVFYDPIINTFPDDVKIYLMFHVIYSYSVAQTILKNAADRIYSLYEEGNMREFNFQIANIIQNINDGKITRKQKAKSSVTGRSLDILTDLDEDYCKHLVNKFLAKDEFKNLDSHGKILTF